MTSNEIEGDIGYYGLEDWWLSGFTEGERKHIEEVYKPFGLTRENPLTEGKVDSSSWSVTKFLTTLAGWFKNPRDRQLANRIITKAEEMNSNNPENVLDGHFLYSEIVSIYYPQREEAGVMDKVIQACEKQIEMAPTAVEAFRKEYPQQPLPAHRGYEQFTIILDKKGEFGKAIKVCEQAKSQGWNGDWDKRVDRYRKKLSRA